MSKNSYVLREKQIIEKINNLNDELKSKNIKIGYSLYNYDGISSKLEKNDLYEIDVATAVFTRIHTCDSQYMIDEVVKSYNIRNDISIEENFYIKVSDIEQATVEDLVEYFGDMNNHEVKGFGKNQNYVVTYKGVNNTGYDVQIVATYGNENKYNVKTSLTQIEKDGTIQKVYSENAINGKLDGEDIIFSQGIEVSNPDLYSVLEKSIDSKGQNKVSINCLGKNKVKYNVISTDDNFENISLVTFGGVCNKYSEEAGKIKEAKGKLACRVDVENNTIIKPNFKNVNSFYQANENADEYYNKYKSNPIIKYDNKNEKFIVEGKSNDLAKLNLTKVLENALNGFFVERNFGIEVRDISEKKYIRKFEK